ncbi:MAG: DUF937 domain-containing protein [Myxococcales bacterium]|nr:DUF937 domain-containing protein [Myxococcales bacterium]MCB9733109.1 DUF937 domain-containing protein [Deltaproteobacteria bacterium]
MSILDLVKQNLTPELIGQLSSQLGASKDGTQSVVAQAVPVLVSALAKNAQTTSGARSLDGALAKDHDGSVLDNLGGLVAQLGAGSAGDGILKHVLGEKRPQVEQQLGQKSGIDLAQVGSVLITLAPIVMGALGKKKQEEGLDADGVAKALREDEQRAEAEAPSFLEQLIDQDKDGDIKDDLLSVGSTILGGFLGKK